MKELTEALNSQSFHFYLHASFIPRRRAAKPADDEHLLRSSGSSSCVVAVTHFQLNECNRQNSNHGRVGFVFPS